MTSVNGQPKKRVVAHAPLCSGDQLGKMVGAIYTYRGIANCVSLDGVKMNYGLQTNFTIRASDNKWYWLQGIILSTGNRATDRLLFQVYLLPFFGIAPSFTTNHFQFEGTDHKTFLNLGLKQGDSARTIIDLRLPSITWDIRSDGNKIARTKALPNELINGIVYQVEAIPVGEGLENVLFFNPASFHVYILSSPLVFMKGRVVDWPGSDKDKTCCADVTLIQTGEDSNLAYVFIDNPTMNFSYTLEVPENVDPLLGKIR